MIKATLSWLDLRIGKLNSAHEAVTSARQIIDALEETIDRLRVENVGLRLAKIQSSSSLSAPLETDDA